VNKYGVHSTEAPRRVVEGYKTSTSRPFGTASNAEQLSKEVSAITMTTPATCLPERFWGYAACSVAEVAPYSQWSEGAPSPVGLDEARAWSLHYSRLHLLFS